MPGITTQSSESRLLQEGVNAVTTIEYKDYEVEADKIFTNYTSEKAYELDVALSGMGLAALKPEGSSLGVYDDEKQDFTQNYTHATYAIGTIITMEAQMFNKYRDLVSKAGKMLKRSVVHTHEQLAADVIDNAYTTNIMDGVPAASTAHVLGKGGTFSNRFAVFTALSQAAIEDAIIAIEDFRDGAGLLIDCRPVSIHIPRQLRFVYERIHGSKFEPNSANTATVNPVAGLLPAHVNHRFASSEDWFIKTDVEDGFKIFTAMDYTFSQDNDWGTENFRSKGMFMKSYGLTDPRCAFWSGT